MNNTKLGKERRNDFTLLRENNDFIYFNSGASSLKPDIVVNNLTKLYKTITYMGRGFELSDDATNEELFFESLNKVSKHVNADKDSVIPTYGSTDFINKIALSTISKLNDGDEIILGDLEHSSNILPWINIAKFLNKRIIFKWYELKDWKIDLEHLKSIVSKKTKIMAFAHIYNTTGAKNDLRSIRDVVGKNVKLIVDGAQAIGHTKINVLEGNIDCYFFGAHKAFGTHNLGFAYLKDLNRIEEPFLYGGNMQKMYTRDSIEMKEGISKFIAGTQDVPGVISFGYAIDYINKLGIENIEKYNNNLQKYAINELKKVPKLRIINDGINSSNIFFEIKNIAGEDVAYHLSQKNIIVRSGANCVKMKNDLYSQTHSIRISLHFFNTKEEIDKLVETLMDGGDFIDALFHKKKPSKICSE